METTKKTKLKIEPYSSIKILNTPNFDEGAIVRSVVKYRWSKYQYVLSITDCERKVELHNSLSNNNDIKNALCKLETLKSEVENLLTHLSNQLKDKRIDKDTKAIINKYKTL